jgi:squalene synthase HpnC
MKNAFAAELARYGPGRLNGPPPLAWARRYCRRLTTTHYENFTVASLLLPRRLLPHFHAIYAYCRWADDLADETPAGEESLRLLAWWRAELLECFAGRPNHPVMVALLPTIRRFAIPPAPFLDLLQAFEQDQRVKRYQSFDELLGYCRNSANPVGHLVLYLCESYDPVRAGLSDRICTALQLTNFWQDVARDFAIGRVYLPEEDRRRFGYADADLEARRFTPEFAELMQFEVERTRAMFHEGLPLIPRMPDEVQLDIELFARGGLAILRKIEQVGYNVWLTRPVLTRWEKGLLLGQTWLRHLRNLGR